ncbi:hypothetical protein PBY51_002967 [Eleginops maclovinus]|uniref:Uncharacterized protein n=1 Tax=Eleginops maclovinus TaxID=56733 RepID=A0AAN8AJV7_ELEMC|nr:hypothetical protein PBY51_002967 [Eleginops maclovinus]
MYPSVGQEEVASTRGPVRPYELHGEVGGRMSEPREASPPRAPATRASRLSSKPSLLQVIQIDDSSPVSSLMVD